jgi:hypothetical protein
MHQVEYLEAISTTNSLLFCENTEDLEKCLSKAKTFDFKKYSSPKCTMDEEIIKFLGD